ncbi:MAG TPA: glycosyltransferase [Flavobacterium sp.]|nr:glycosyltransferase [Flavobacterium sp.]
MPLVSVITPAYNSERFLADAIRSVQSQTHPDWEMVVVDDASSDNTPNIARAFAEQDRRVRFIRLENNQGAGAARQTALDAAKGRYIAFLDADDVWKPQKLERQLAFMNEHGQSFAFSFYEWMEEDGRPAGKTITAPAPLSYRQLFFCNFVGNLTGIYDTHYFGKIPFSTIRKRQDWMIWLTVLKRIRSASPVPESLAFYRLRSDSISSSKVGMLRYNFAVYRQFHRLHLVTALGCMALFLFTQLLVKPRFVKRSD